MKDEREHIVLNPEQMWCLLELMKLKPRCKYCGKTIRKGQKFSIFNKPTRVCCNNILCLSQLTIKEDDNDG